jgi:cell division protein FtsA
MPKDQFIVALDVGSSKISCVVASVDKGRISVVGTHTVKSKGIREGVVNNIDKAVSAISEVLNKTEMMSGQPISHVVVCINGTHIESFNSRGVVAVSGADSEIAPEDIARVNEAAQATSLPSSREIIHVIPREYIVDKQKGISDPTGMTGVRLEVEANIVHGSTTSIKNLTRSIQQIGVEVDMHIYNGYAAAEAVLTDTEKELGTVLIDIGGGTMSMIIYNSGKPVFSAVLPIGGQHITNDLAIGLRALLDDAEKIKLRYSEETQNGPNEIIINKDGYESKVPRGEMYVGDLNIGMETVPLNIVTDIVNKRIEEAFKFVKIYFKKSGYAEKLPAGVVLTGGCSQLKGISKIAEEVFKLPVRIGKPIGISGLADQIQDPSYASVIGALLIVSSTISEDHRTFGKKSANIGKIGNRVFSFIRSFLP